MPKVDVCARPVTVIVPTWKRPENLPEVIASIRKQSVPSYIFVWDNGASTQKPYKGKVDFLVSSSLNWGCWARFPMMAFVRTPYVWQMDDDLILTEPDVFEKYIAISKTLGDKAIVGAGGKVLHPGEKPYQASKGAGPGPAVMVNTGFTLFPSRIISQIPLNPLYCSRPIVDADLHNADDPWICSYCECHVAGLLSPSGREWYGIARLSERGLGVSHNSDHMDRRNRICQQYLTGKRLAMEAKGEIKRWADL